MFRSILFLFKFIFKILNIYFHRHSNCPNCKIKIMERHVGPLYLDFHDAVIQEPSNNGQNHPSDIRPRHVPRPKSTTIPQTARQTGSGRRRHNVRQLRQTYDRNVVMSAQQVRLPNRQPMRPPVYNNNGIRKSSRTTQPIDRLNYEMKCPACKRRFCEIIPKALYDGFVACATECYNRTFNS